MTIISKCGGHAQHCWIIGNCGVNAQHCYIIRNCGGHAHHCHIIRNCGGQAQHCWIIRNCGRYADIKLGFKPIRIEKSRAVCWGGEYSTPQHTHNIITGISRCRLRSERGGTRKGKLANGVGSQYSHAASERGVSNITQADAHTSAASSRLNWRPPPI